MPAVAWYRPEQGGAVVVDDAGALLDGAVIVYGTVVGPASYVTGGFALDLSAVLSDVKSFAIVKTDASLVGGGPTLRAEVNQPANGQVRLSVWRTRYDRAGSIGNITGQPAGVTVQAASGAAVAGEAAHTHAPGTLANPDHATQADPDTGIGGPAVPSPAHGAITGATAAGTSHAHVDDNIYQHAHTPTLTDTLTTVQEVGAGGNLSTLSWRYIAIGAAP